MILRVAGEGQYTFADPDSGLEFRADYVRRDARSGELGGELSVSGGSEDGVLSRGSFNFSSVSGRSQRAKLVNERAKGSTRKADVLGCLEVFCQYIADQERSGQPAVVLRSVQSRRPDDRCFEVLGMQFPSEHLSFLFGAGGTMKSYLALRIAADLAQRGRRVCYVDWELNAEDHRYRLECLTGPSMPEGVLYRRCNRPLVHEVDSLRRIGRAERIDYYVLDSVGYGTAGDPAAADAAMDFNRAAGQLEGGKLGIAHITKNGETNDQMPYGSVFWHNSARCTYNVKLSAESSDGTTVTLGVFQRKNNLGRLRRPVGIEATFGGDSVSLHNSDIATVDEFRASLPTWQLVQGALRRGPMTFAELAAETGKSAEAIKKAVQRGDMFTKLPGGMGVPPRVALAEMRAS